MTLSIDPRVLIAAGWRPEELSWEALMEEGGEESIAEALRLARANFEPDDPRLAASLIAHAAVLEGRGDDASTELFREAVGIWRAAEGWVSKLKPEKRSRSAHYHLRLETRYSGQYDRFSEARYAALYEEGLAAAEAHAAGGSVEDRRARWSKEKPEGLNDRRRLLAAVCLMPPRP